MQTSVATLELAPSDPTKPTIGEQARFALRLSIAQLLNSHSWCFFNHLGISRAQNLVPRFARRRYGILLCGIEAWTPNLTADRKKVLRNAAVRIAISRYTAKRVGEQHPGIGPVITCPLALLPATSVAATFDHTLLGQIRQASVLIVGRMSFAERYKGHDELLESWNSVLKQMPGAQLVVAGQGDDVTRLREKAASLGLSNDVLFLGFVADGTLEAIRQRVALFALPSRGEGFGLVYLDAMRAGLACIGGAHDAAADVIVHDETGLLVDPNDREALAASIVGLLRAPERRAAYGAAGKRRFEKEFTFERYCDRLRPILVDAFA
jgi:phosphatidylinositol alpha-1,6-mannosyltransferase